MKHLLFTFLISFCLYSTRFELKSEPYSAGCEYSHRAIATCLNSGGRGVVSCTKSLEPTTSLSGKEFYYKVISCGNSPRMPLPRCQTRAAHFEWLHTPNLCKRHLKKHSTESFADYLSCFGDDVQAKLRNFCPKGCVGKPRVSICYWTRAEFEIYKNCASEEYPGEAAYFYENLCGPQQALVDQNDGNPPTFTLDGKNVKDARGRSLHDIFKDQVIVNIRNVRGRTGSYCLDKLGDDIPCTEQSFAYTGQNEYKYRVTVTELGSYKLTATSSENNKSSSISFQVVSAGADGSLCAAEKGFHCKRNGKRCRNHGQKAIERGCMQRERFYLCGKNPPSGDEWGPAPYFMSATGDSCQGWEAIHDMNVPRSMSASDFGRAQRPVMTVSCSAQGPGGGSTSWSHSVQIRPFSKELISLTTSYSNENLEPSSGSSAQQNYVDPKSPFERGMREGDNCHEFVAHSGVIKPVVINEETGKPVLDASGNPQRTDPTPDNPGRPFEQHVKVCFGSNGPTIAHRAKIDGSFNINKGWVDHGCKF